MPLVINSNITSLNSQRQLVKSGNELDQAMERLSSGKRINSAADDAAGLAISNRQTSQIRGLDRAVANAADGVSLIQTAEGALDETTNILQRMRELSIQSANGIYSDADRTTLDAEVQQLKAEMDRIAGSTAFNGQRILDGSLGDIDLQVGSEANQTIGFNIAAMDTSSLGSGAGGDIVGDSIAAGFFSMTAGTVEINGQDIGGISTHALATVSTGGMQGALDDINANVSGVTFDAILEMTASADGTGIIRSDSTLNLSVVMMDGRTQVYEISDVGSMEELADKIVSTTGGVLNASLNSDGKLLITSDEAAQITTSESGTAGAEAAAGFGAGSVELANLTITADESTDDITIEFQVVANATAAALSLGLDERSASGDIVGVQATSTALAEGDIIINGVTVGAATSTGAVAKVEAINELSAETGVVASLATGATGGTTSIKLDSVSGEEIKLEFAGNGTFSSLGLRETNNSESVGKSVDNIDISTAAGAQSAIDVIDGALETINATRSDLGAINNRLDFTMSNLMNVSENTSAARSRIVDADFAAETANLSRAQVLQQASSAMLAQANAAPQQVLSLLR